MAGEVLTGGLSEPEIYASGVLTGLDYINVSHVVGMLYFKLTLSFLVGRSNILQYAIYSKELGSSTWSLFYVNYLDATDGANKDVTIEALLNRAWLIAIMPMQNVVRKVDCSFILKAMSRMNLSESYAGSSKNKLLRICNNMKSVPYADTASFDTWDYIPNLSSSINHKMTTSVGTLMQNGQYIFGQN